MRFAEKREKNEIKSQTKSFVFWQKDEEVDGRLCYAWVGVGALCW